MVISPRQDLDSVDTQAMSHNRAITPECRSASVNTHNMTISVQTPLFINQNQQTDLTGLRENKVLLYHFSCHSDRGMSAKQQHFLSAFCQARTWL